MKNDLARIQDSLTTAGFAFSCVLVALLALAVMVDVFMRYVVGTSLMIVDELAGYSLVTMTFYCVAQTTRSRAHVRIEFLVSRYPKKVRDLFEVVTDVLGLVLIGIVAYLFIQMIAYTGAHNLRSNQYSEMPMIYPEAIPVGGMLIIALQHVGDMARHISKMRETTAKEGSGTNWAV